MGKPETVICTYRVMEGSEGEFIALLERHWPELNRLGLATAEPSRVYQGADRDHKPFFNEIFTWTDGDAVERAHADPAVLALWEPMEKLCESRGGRPAMEFPHVQPLKMTFSRG